MSQDTCREKFGIHEEFPPPGPFGESSVFCRSNSPSKLGTKNTFDVAPNESALELSGEVTDALPFLRSLRKTQIEPDQKKKKILIVDAVTSRAKSVNSAKSITKRANGLINFYLDTRSESAVTLTGERSVVLIRDCLDSLEERWVDVTASTKHAITVWADALGIDWPLTNPLVLSASSVDSKEGPPTGSCDGS